MRALVVGHGRMGRFHANALRDLGLNVTTIDPDPAADADRLKWCGDRFDVACIAVPIPLLAETASRTIDAGIPTLIEKPMAATATEAINLAGLAARRKTRVGVGYVERFNPQVRRLKQDGPVGWARFERHNDRHTDDPLLDLTSHDIDLAHWLGVMTEPMFDVRIGVEEKRRRIVTDRGTVDLMDHRVSPLHAQWHRFLTDGHGVANVWDAIRVLRAVDRLRPQALAA